MFKRLFAEGFRIFFLSACLFALVAMGVEPRTQRTRRTRRQGPAIAMASSISTIPPAT